MNKCSCTQRDRCFKYNDISDVITEILSIVFLTSAAKTLKLLLIDKLCHYISSYHCYLFRFHSYISNIAFRSVSQDRT